MHEMTWDFESRSAANLNNSGSWRYAADPTTQILCLCYAIDDGEVQTWLPPWVTKQLGLAEQPVPEVFSEIAANPKRVEDGRTPRRIRTLIVRAHPCAEARLPRSSA